MPKELKNHPKNAEQAETALTQIVKPQTAVMPAFLQEQVGHKSGLEAADKEDFTLPRLAICQELTPQKKKSNPRYIEDLEVGDFFNTITGQNFGPKINVLPLFFTKQRIKFNTPIGSGIDCQSPNGKTGGRHAVTCRQCGFSQFLVKTNDKGSTAPPCTEFKNMVLLVQDGDNIVGPLLFSNKSTALTTMKQWISFMNLDNLPVFAKTYTLESTVTVKNNNEFYVWNFNQLGYVAEPAFRAAEAFFNSLHDKDIAFHPEDIEAEESGESEPVPY